MRRKKICERVLSAIIALLFIFASKAPAFGTTYYVSANGDDSNPGTKSGPWRTIQKAADTMVAGDTVTVSEGTYDERISAKISGISDSLITYVADGTVYINGLRITGNYVTVDGFAISGKSPSNWRGLVLIDANYVTVRNLKILGGSFGGGDSIVVIDTGSNFSHLDNCEISGFETSVDHPIIAVYGSNNTVSNCSIHDCTGADVFNAFGDLHTFKNNISYNWSLPSGSSPHVDWLQTWDEGKGDKRGLTNFTIESNFIYWSICNRVGYPDDSVTFLMLAGAGPGIVKNNLIHVESGININNADGGVIPHDLEIYNNTFVGDLAWNNSVGYPAAISIGPGNNITVKNNIIQDYWYEHIGFRSGTGLVADYNCQYNSDGSTPGGEGQGGHGVWKQDPKLGGDFGIPAGYKPRVSSPCVDVGMSLSDVTGDYDGMPRPQGSGYDMGAYEIKKVRPSPPSMLRIVN